ncbi:hypothetical protein OAO42_00660 [Candidatus Izimaplasma bacterium]|nr:hypothetical protein [Candidatus Izimaplasma bacterium]
MVNKLTKVDREQVRNELAEAQLLEIQKNLLNERRKRITVLAFLLSALLFTVIYGTIENPFQYTFSKIGNRFNFSNRLLFVIWASYTGFAIQSAIIALFSLEEYKPKWPYIAIITGAIFLVATAVSPSLDHWPFLQWVHIITAGLFGLFLTLGFFPFSMYVAKENPRLRRVTYIWLSVIWGGSFIWIGIYGNTGVFELWFFGTFILFLLYLSLTLFEERIVKQSIILLRDEENLNLGIEKIFIDLEKKKSDKKS